MTRQRPGRALLVFTLIVVVATAGAVAGYVLGGVYGAIVMPEAGLEGLLTLALGAVAGSVGATLLELGVLYKLPRIRRRHFGAAVGASAGLALLGLGGYAVSDASQVSLSLFVGELPVALFLTAAALGVVMATVAASSRAFGWPDLDALDDAQP